MNATAFVRRSAVLMTLVFALAALAGCQLIRPANTVPEPDYWPTEGWRTGPPEAAGFLSDKMAEGLLAIREEGTPIHSLTIIRHGYVALDAYFYPYDGSTVHDLASVTKSVMTTLIGIAADQGKLSLDDPMVSFFPDRTIGYLDERKQRITVADLASMSSGLECSEANGEETWRAMSASQDWMQFTLDLPTVWDPGTHFVYCSSALHLLSAILEQATGMTALEFARANLFAPLGIQDVIWATDPQGHNTGSGELYLHPLDAAKLGLLWLHQGEWDGRQIVSREWVAASTQRRMTETAGRAEDYGYGWWISAEDEPFPFAMATGVGGQNVRVYPTLDMLLVTTGGGLDMSMIVPYLAAAIGDFERPVPANPTGVAEMEAAVASVAALPPASAVSALPEIARAISGRTYVFEENAALIEWVRLDFMSPTEASFELANTVNDEPRFFTIGLDGIYRMASDEKGLPSGGRGYWEGENTFVIDYNQIANLEHYTLRLTFEGDEVALNLEESVYGSHVTTQGLVQAP